MNDRDDRMAIDAHPHLSPRDVEYILLPYRVEQFHE